MNVRMGKAIQLTAPDGFTLDAWRADPPGRARGGVIVLQENAGLTSHIKDVTEGFAADGYVAVAPALYDRVGRNLVFDYSEEGREQRRATRSKVDLGKAMLDCAAALAEASAGGKVAIIGYCWGGSVAWLAAARVAGLACAVSYYGSAIAGMLAEQPACPFVFHWGAKDRTLALEEVRKIEAAHPGIPSYVYDAGHAFNNPNDSHVPEAARLARERTLDFFARHLV
jgi:carboxymethylenebutenolidase